MTKNIILVTVFLLGFLPRLSYAQSSLDSLRNSAMEALYTQQDIYKSIKLWDAYLKKDSLDADAWYQRGISYRAISRFEFAISDFTQAIRLSPTTAEYYALRAKCREQSSKLTLEDAYEIILDYNFALVYNPKKAEYWWSRAERKLYTLTTYITENPDADKSYVEKELFYVMDACEDYYQARQLEVKLTQKAVQKCSVFESLFTDAFRERYLRGNAE